MIVSDTVLRASGTYPSPFAPRCKIIILTYLVLIFFVLPWMQGCAHHMTVPPDSPSNLYQADPKGPTDWVRLAPLFLTHGANDPWNRIGSPRLKTTERGKVRVFVSPEEPAYFVRTTSFSTAGGVFTNYIYRVHFAGIPYSLIPFNLTAGKNAGLLVIITVNQDRKPVLVTTVHTCGCYLSIIPTSFLPEEALPPNHDGRPVKVYGEEHPPVLNFDPDRGDRLVVVLRPDVHRVMDLRVASLSWTQDAATTLVQAKLLPAENLRQLTADGVETSFFHEKGMLKGFVKGSVKPWETLFMSWMAFDLWVGTDKAFNAMADTDNPFYTSLKPWNRQKSNMWHFDRFLRFWGFNL